MGQTPMHIAALWGNVEAIQVLLAAGANVNVENVRGTTPLHFAAAARKNAKATVEVLLKAGAKTDITDMSGRQAYECALEGDVRALLGGPDPRLFAFCSDGK